MEAVTPAHSQPLRRKRRAEVRSTAPAIPRARKPMVEKGREPLLFHPADAYTLRISMLPVSGAEQLRASEANVTLPSCSDTGA